GDVLARDGSAPRDRRGPARRPGHARPRRAGQRSRPRRRAVGAPARARPGGRGPRRAPLVPPHARARAVRRPRRRHRARPARRGRLARGRVPAAHRGRGRVPGPRRRRDRHDRRRRCPMTATTTASRPARPTAHRPADAGGPTLLRVVAAQWTALTSLRSSWWAAALTVVVSGVLTHLSAQASSVDPGFDPLGSLTSGVVLSQVPPLVLGVLVGTGDFSTGAFRTTYVAVPRRWPVLVAQTVATAAFALLTAVAAVAAAVL